MWCSRSKYDWSCVRSGFQWQKTYYIHNHTFNTFRCFEQIRLDVCYPNLPVIIVGTGSGLSYASLGATHHSMEDISVLKSLPNLQIICPGDKLEVKEALIKAYNSGKPTYIRLGKKGEPVVHEKPNW